MFKRIINSLLICSLVAGQPSFAGKYYDDAVKAVSTEFLNLESTVQHMILYDVQGLLSQVMQSSSLHSQYLSQMSAIDKRLLELTSGFLNISSLSTQEIQDLQKHIEQEISRYSDYNRQLYEVTWIPPTVALLQSNFKSQFEQLIRSFRTMCKTGRSKFGYVGPALAIPPDPMSFFVMVTAGNDGNSEVTYEQNNYGDKDLSNIARRSSEALGLGLSFYSSTGSSLALGATVASAAVLAAVVIAIQVTGLRKYNKRMRDYIAGEVYKIHNSPTSQDINAAYKESCTELVAILDEVLPLITRAISGTPNEKNQARAIVNEKAKSSPEFQNDFKELMETFSRRSLLESYQNGSCIHQQKEYRKRDENLCQVVGSTLYAPRNSYQIENPNIQEIEDLKKKEDEIFNSIASGNINHIIYQTIQNHVFKAEDQLKSFNTNTFRNALYARHNAFLRLNKLLSLSSKLQDEAIQKELTSFKLFMDARKELLDIVAAAIECTFRKIDKAIVLSMIERFTPKMNTLMDRFGHISEVRSLQSSFSQLKSYTHTL